MKTVDPGHFRSVMGNFATGVTVITATAETGPVGMTANAVASLSLEPLLLLVAFDNTARTLQVVRETERFGVNVLARRPGGARPAVRLQGAGGRQVRRRRRTPCTTGCR